MAKANIIFMYHGLKAGAIGVAFLILMLNRSYPFLIGITVGVSLPGVTSGRSGITGFSSGMGFTSGVVLGCCGSSCGTSGISFVAIGMN